MAVGWLGEKRSAVEMSVNWELELRRVAVMTTSAMQVRGTPRLRRNGFLYRVRKRCYYTSGGISTISALTFSGGIIKNRKA